ncbi:hypothetical protein WKH56_20395 [Priestia sp. SB1]|uniref:hypothetical protein n=1 Tax=Priestia sp. SB1 TaxID=3132359 RepID=UPI003181599A
MMDIYFEKGKFHADDEVIGVLRSRDEEHDFHFGLNDEVYDGDYIVWGDSHINHIFELGELVQLLEPYNIKIVIIKDPRFDFRAAIYLKKS